MVLRVRGLKRMLLMHCLLISFAVRIVHSVGFIARPSVLHRRRNLKATAPMNQMSTSRKRMSQLLHAVLINAVRSMAATGTACPAGQYRPSTASDIADCTDVLIMSRHAVLVNTVRSKMAPAPVFDAAGAQLLLQCTMLQLLLLLQCTMLQALVKKNKEHSKSTWIPERFLRCRCKKKQVCDLS